MSTVGDYLQNLPPDRRVAMPSRAPLLLLYAAKCLAVAATW